MEETNPLGINLRTFGTKLTRWKQRLVQFSVKERGEKNKTTHKPENNVFG